MGDNKAEGKDGEGEKELQFGGTGVNKLTNTLEGPDVEAMQAGQLYRLEEGWMTKAGEKILEMKLVEEVTAFVKERRKQHERTTNQIVIKGKLARRIYEQILSKDKAMDIENTGTEEMPILVIRKC